MMILFKRNFHKSKNNCQEPIKVIYLFYIFQAAITPAIMPTPHTWKTLDETSLLNTIKWTYINDQNMKLSFDIFWNTKGTCMNNICDFYLSNVCANNLNFWTPKLLLIICSEKESIIIPLILFLLVQLSMK